MAPTVSSRALAAPSPAKLRLSNLIMSLKALHIKNEEAMLKAREEYYLVSVV
jgi:hypothetical protein